MNPEPLLEEICTHVRVRLAMVWCLGDFKNIIITSKENQLYELFDNINKNQTRTVSLPMVRSEKH